MENVGLKVPFHKSTQKFTIVDYIRMWKSRGIHLPIQYFFQNHLFDIIHHTDTHFRLNSEDYTEHPDGFDSGGFYMCSSTLETKKSLKFVEKKLGKAFFDFQFLDLGCGKGKTPIVYSLLYKNKAHHKAIGIDYYKPLVDIAIKNSALTGVAPFTNVVYGDARSYDNYCTSSNLLFYLYNPFNEDILSDILLSSKNKEVYIIYTHPVCQKTVLESGFELIYSKKGRYPSSTTSIFYRSKI